VAGRALTDFVSLGVLASRVPRDAVDDAVEATGKGARRKGGKLPPHVVVYLVMALALFARGLRGGRRAADRDAAVVGLLGGWLGAACPLPAETAARLRQATGREHVLHRSGNRG